jgi:hypothetical protein
MKTNKLAPYKNRKKPTVFYGLYTARDLSYFKKHKSLIILVWGGSDILRKKNLKTALKKKNVLHVARSSFIARDLEKVGIPYKLIPLIASPVRSIKPTVMGDKIYAYIPKDAYEFYGGHIMEKVRERVKYKIIRVTRSDRYTRKKLFKIYNQCFCGLRPTQHDGVANTVIEMGMKGRMCIYNGGTPNAISWDENNIDQIVENIEKEANKIGTVNEELHNKMKEYITVGRRWLKTSFWDK